MEKNVGGIDRIARLVGGPLLAVAGIAMVLGTLGGGQALGAVLLLVGAILIGTGVTSRCLIHRVTGMNTARRD